LGGQVREKPPDGEVKVTRRLDSATAPPTAIPVVSAVYVLSFCGFWVLCGQSLGNIVTWYANELDLTSGYPDAISKGILQPYSLAKVLASYAATLLLTFGGIQLAMRRTGIALMLAGAIAATGYVSLKHAFGGNQFENATAALLFVSFLTLTLATNRDRLVARSCAAIFASQVIFLAVFFHGGATAAVVAGAPRQLRDRALQIAKLLHGDVSEYRVGWEHMLQTTRDRAPLSKDLSGTADVYPQKTGVVIADGNLRWTPRPAYLSLNAHTERLAKMNADFLSSARAPDTLLIEMLPPIHNYNNRLPSTTDGPSWIEFLARYSLSSVSPPFLVLTRAEERKITWGRAKTRTLEVNEYRSVNDRSRPLWATIDIRPSIEGRVLALLYKLPQVYVDLVLNDGRIVSHQIVPELGRAGVLLSPYVASKEDLAAFLLGDRLIPGTVTGGRRVTSLRWRVEGDLARFYRPQAVIHLTPFSFPPRSVVGLQSTIALEADAECAGAKADFTTVETSEGEKLSGVLTHAPCRSELLVPEQVRRASFVYGLKDSSFSNLDGGTNGAEFRVTATFGEDPAQKEIWAQRLFPSEIAADRGLHRASLEIPPGATSLSFETLPIGSNVYDHTYWASVRFSEE
jgi:hypothetical protein